MDLNFISQRENVVVINTAVMGLNLNNKDFIFFVWYTCPGAISLNVSGVERMGNLNLVHIRLKTMDVLEERQGK